MTPEQMQASGQKKIDQIMGLMKILKVEVKAVDKITKNMIIEKVVIFTDTEKYPELPPVAPVVVPEVIPAPNNEKSDVEQPL